MGRRCEVGRLLKDRRWTIVAGLYLVSATILFSPYSFLFGFGLVLPLVVSLVAVAGSIIFASVHRSTIIWLICTPPLIVFFVVIYRAVGGLVACSRCHYIMIT